MKEPTIYFSDSVPSKWVDADYALNPREILSLDRIVYGVVRHKAVLQKWLPTVAVPKGMLQRELSIAQELNEPIFTRDFMKEDIDEVRKSAITYTLAAMHKDFRINMIDIDASRNQNYYNQTIEALNVREAALTLTDYKERVLYRGYDILDKAKTAGNKQGLIDTNVKGLINPPTAAGTINSFAAAGDNAGIDSAGDGPLSIGAAMASLIADEAYGPYVFQMTPDVYGQLAQNFNSTTHISDIERMHAMIDLDGNKILEGLDSTKYLIALEAVADNGSMLMFQRKTPAGEPTAVVLESYPVAHYPTQHSSLGIKGKILWMGCAATMRPDFFTLETAVDLIA
ncbi:MAG: hypothetical protein GY853_16725 [PVC group bacterium]|nr:hypothetical protein [PVC group bacterium]